MNSPGKSREMEKIQQLKTLLNSNTNVFEVCRMHGINDQDINKYLGEGIISIKENTTFKMEKNEYNDPAKTWNRVTELVSSFLVCKLSKEDAQIYFDIKVVSAYVAKHLTNQIEKAHKHQGVLNWLFKGQITTSVSFNEEIAIKQDGKILSVVLMKGDGSMTCGQHIFESDELNFTIEVSFKAIQLQTNRIEAHKGLSAGVLLDSITFSDKTKYLK